MRSIFYLLNDPSFALIFIAQILCFSSMTSFVLTIVLATQNIAPSLSLSTVPYTLMYVGASLSSFFIGMMLKKMSTKIVFLLGHFIGFFALVLMVIAIYDDNFILLSFAGLLYGINYACWVYYRFEASNMVIQQYREYAISMITSAGIIGAFIGPNIAIITDNITGYKDFTLNYSVLACLHILCCFILLPIKFKTFLSSDHQQIQNNKEQFSSEISPQKLLAMFLSGTFSAAIGYGIMVFMMVSAAVAMDFYKHHFDDIAIVVQTHIIGMYLPVLFVGFLIKKLTSHKIILAGYILFVIAMVTAITSVELLFFWIALLSLGIAWSFNYVTGSALISQVTNISSDRKYQAIGEAIIMFMTAFAALSAGIVFATIGWQAISFISLIIIVIGIISQMILKKYYL